MITEEKLNQYRAEAQAKLVQMTSEVLQSIENEDYEEAIQAINVLNCNVISLISIDQLLEQ